MPQGDRTGPNGQGPMTGRGLGYCNGYNGPGYNRGMPMGRGAGFRRGFGRGFRWRVPARAVPQEFVPVRQEPYTYSKEDEIQNLKNEVNILEQEKKDINQELEELKKRIEEVQKE